MKNTTRLVGAVLIAIIAFVGGWEGKRNFAYRDIVGVPTICFGETRGVKMGDKATDEECAVMLGEGLKDFERGMRRCLDEPDKIPDGPYVAFLSLSYNIGTGAFCRSSARRLANEGRYREACDAILLWNRAGGHVVQGLVNRRRHEREICLEGLGAV